MFPKIVGFPPKSSHFKTVFPLFSPIHFGVPLFLETPNRKVRVFGVKSRFRKQNDQKPVWDVLSQESLMVQWFQWVIVPLNYDCGLWGSEWWNSREDVFLDPGVFVAECFIGFWRGPTKREVDVLAKVFDWKENCSKIDRSQIVTKKLVSFTSMFFLLSEPNHQHHQWKPSKWQQVFHGEVVGWACSFGWWKLWRLRKKESEVRSFFQSKELNYPRKLTWQSKTNHESRCETRWWCVWCHQRSVEKIVVV